MTTTLEHTVAGHPPVDGKKILRFRILSGRHYGRDPYTGEDKYYRARGIDPETNEPDSPEYTGDVIETTLNLAGRFNVPNYPRRFEPLNEYGVPLGSPLSVLQPREDESKEEYIVRMASLYDQTMQGHASFPQGNQPIMPPVHDKEKEKTPVQLAVEKGFYGEQGKPQSPPPKNNPELDGMGVKQLQDLAAEEEIPVQGLTKKDDLVRVIRDALRLKSKGK